MDQQIDVTQGVRAEVAQAIVDEWITEALADVSAPRDEVVARVERLRAIREALS